ncbi:uncharacterized protein SOCEGT47_004960 [Sorangium cellulosum]|uniref:Uncharacterized protein n=1 Tax=Sorangium cellulosum TaxID=56 RepID=A0A4P2PUH0_SORCE|nr:uncharacterized protein SOCEGT47_004960 [Sorangium cellulosum]
MKHRYHEHQGLFEHEKDSIRKDSNQRATNAGLDLRKLERILYDTADRGIQLRLESESEIASLPLVPKRGVEDFDLRFLADLKPSHRCAARSRESRSRRASSHGRLEP